MLNNISNFRFHLITDSIPTLQKVSLEQILSKAFYLLNNIDICQCITNDQDTPLKFIVQ